MTRLRVAIGRWWRKPTASLRAGLTRFWEEAGHVRQTLTLLRQQRAARRQRSATLRPTPRTQPLRTWMIAVGALAVIVVTCGAVWWLQGGVPTAGAELERAKLRVETIRTGLSIGAAVGAALALVLAFRRQQLSELGHVLAERAQASTEHDAGERRVTELYIKAVEQLGSDKAPVRLAGLYALERLAQDHPAHRQSIVDVVCAYLRMPFTEPPKEPVAVRQGRARGFDLPGGVLPAVVGGTAGSGPDPREEREVRLTAQRILNRHLVEAERWEEPDLAWWGRFNVDLAGATLIDFNLLGCHLGAADFSDARFIGHVSFRGTHFSGTARFQRALFERAVFTSTVFDGGSNFNLAFFDSFARFDSARFAGGVRFRGTNFRGGGVSFHSARFSGRMEFVATRWPGRDRIEFGMVSMDDAAREKCGDVWVPGWRFDEDEDTFVRTSTVETDDDLGHMLNLGGQLRQLRKQARSRHQARSRPHPRRRLVSRPVLRPRDAPEEGAG